MKALMGLITALSVPLMILNILGGIVSGIWLAILGRWGTVGLDQTAGAACWLAYIHRRCSG